MINSIAQAGSTVAQTVSRERQEFKATGAQVSANANAIAQNQENADKRPASKAQVEEAAEKVKSFVQAINRDLNFSVDKDTDQLVVKVIDSGTKEVIRQIPSEEMLNIAKALDKLQGLFVQQKA